MPNRRICLAVLFGLANSYLLTACTELKGSKMQEIKFDLGKNIVETAKASGVPKFNVDSTAGLVQYEVHDIPAGITAKYIRSGYEVVLGAVHAFSISSDKEISASLPVQSARLGFSSKAFKTHESAKAFVDQVISQFQKGSWQRYADPESRVLLTGRSSLLNEKGDLEFRYSTPIDPGYKISPKDWIAIVAEGIQYEWAGDGVLAVLDIKFNDYRETNPEMGLYYSIGLEFTDLANHIKKLDERIAQDNKEGDAKGWNSTAKYEASKKSRQALNKILEANALKRGDSIVRIPPVK